VAGQPTHQPVQKPWPSGDDEYFGFLMELWVDGARLQIPDCVCLQVYRTIDPGDLPGPEIVVVRPGDPLNEKGDIPVHPAVEPWDISFEAVEEPETLPEIQATPESGKFFMSKLGGLDPWEEDEGRTFIGQISESPVGFNFAGLCCSLYLLPDGSVKAELH